MRTAILVIMPMAVSLRWQFSTCTIPSRWRVTGALSALRARPGGKWPEAHRPHTPTRGAGVLLCRVGVRTPTLRQEGQSAGQLPAAPFLAAGCTREGAEGRTPLMLTSSGPADLVAERQFNALSALRPGPVNETKPPCPKSPGKGPRDAPK